MKKLLLVIMVLGLATASANAGTVWTFNTDSSGNSVPGMATISVSIVGSTLTVTASDVAGMPAGTLDLSFGLYNNSGDATTSNLNPLAAAGGLGTISNGYGYGVDAAVTWNNTSGIAPVAGDWFTFDMTDIVAGDTLEVWNYGISDAAKVGDITVTPEPATLCLLGLGGLAILRKRKA